MLGLNIPQKASLISAIYFSAIWLDDEFIGIGFRYRFEILGLLLAVFGIFLFKDKK